MLASLFGLASLVAAAPGIALAGPAPAQSSTSDAAAEPAPAQSSTSDAAAGGSSVTKDDAAALRSSPTEDDAAVRSSIVDDDAPGTPGDENKIAFGRPVTANPGVVRLERPSGTQFCSGSLIAPTWVLTAAHCLVETSASRVRVRSGALAVTAGVVTAAAELHVHPDYAGATSDNDVGLVRLASPVAGPYLGYAASGAEVDTRQAPVTATVMGFGETERSRSADRLLSVRLRLPPTWRCSVLEDEVYGATFTSDDRICGVWDGGPPASAPCFGDSGGPWLVADRVVGVESYGTPCDGVYDVAANVATLSGWIAATSGVTPAGPARAVRDGYWMADAQGFVYDFGAADHLGQPVNDFGSYPDCSLGRSFCDQIVSIDGVGVGGYVALDSTGFVWTYGAARSHGDLYVEGAPLVTPARTITATNGGGGYWVVDARGAVYAFGDAAFHGDMTGVTLNAPVVASAIAASGDGYWFVAGDGGVFSFGDARFWGSVADLRLNAPVVGMAPTASGRGYWLVASDGGIFAFGDAKFHGSMGGRSLNAPVVGMVPSASGRGYLLVAADGGIFAFGDVAFRGSLGSTPPALPIVDVAVVEP